MRRVLAVLGLLLIQATPATNFDVQRLTDGVYAVIRQDPPGLMVDANNVFIVGDKEVAVVDANGAPAITREVLAAIRRVTRLPVRHVINTHYHDDHIRGNQVYRDEFPGVTFVGHPYSREYLPAQGAVNRANFLEGAPGFVVQLKGMLRDGKSLLGGSLSDEERVSMASDVGLADVVLEHGASAETVLPTVTVNDRLTLHVGTRTLEILHLGRGHTAADVVVHLPQDRIVVAGDLVVWPVPLVGDQQSHIADWAVTLGKLRTLGAVTIVPGHGPVLRGDDHVATIQEMFASLASQTVAAVERGLALDDVRKTVNLDVFRAKLAGESRVRQLLFGNYVERPAVAAAFRGATAGRLPVSETASSGRGRARELR